MSSRINKVVKSEEKRLESSHLNYMGGVSYDVNDPFNRLHMISASSFFGEPKYYDADKNSTKHTSRYISSSSMSYLRETLQAIDPQEWRDKSFTEITENTINECLNIDVEKTLQIASRLRNEDNIRTTPQIIMVLAAMHKNAIGTGLVQKIR